MSGPSSDAQNRILLGRILGPHGIRGDVVIETYTAEPRDIAGYGRLESEDGKRQFEIKVVRETPKGLIARVAGIADRTAAEPLKGTRLFVDRARLPEAGEGEFYYADLVGLRVEDGEGHRLGEVVAVVNYGAGDLLEVRLDGARKTELVPFTETFVPLVDVENGRVVVALPEVTEADGKPPPKPKRPRPAKDAATRR